MCDKSTRLAEATTRYVGGGAVAMRPRKSRGTKGQGLEPRPIIQHSTAIRPAGKGRNPNLTATHGKINTSTNGEQSYGLMAWPWSPTLRQRQTDLEHREALDARSPRRGMWHCDLTNIERRGTGPFAAAWDAALIFCDFTI